MSAILVVGGTGMLGKPVVNSLSKAGYAVSVLTRDAAAARKTLGDYVAIVTGDISDEKSIARAIEGCEGVHVNLAAGMNPTEIDRVEHQGTARIVRLAKEAGVQRLTYLSGGHTSDEPIWNTPSDRGMTSIAKSRAEYAIRESGVPYTIFRATMFMETLPRLARGGGAMLFGKKPAPFHWLAAQDYATMVARSFATPAAANKTLYPRGPEALTLMQALQQYQASVKPDLKITVLPEWVLGMIGKLIRRPAVGELVKLMKFFGTVPEVGSPTECDLLLGRATTTLSSWCASTAAAA